MAGLLRQEQCFGQMPLRASGPTTLIMKETGVKKDLRMSLKQDIH